MSGLIIDSEACVGCGRCVRACASGGIVVEGERPNRCAHVTDGCILCGGCVDACPVNAISIERDEAAGAVDLDAYRDIWVFVQTDEHDDVAPVAYELMGKGRELADARGCRLVALVGMGPEGSLEDLEHLVCAGADEVLVCRDERLRQNDAEVYARLIRLHRAFDGYGDGPAATDASGVWRQLAGHHYLPQPPSPDGNGAPRHL